MPIDFVYIKCISTICAALLRIVSKLFSSFILWGSYAACMFKKRSEKCLEGPSLYRYFFKGRSPSLCFVSDCVDMGLPSSICGQRNVHIFGLGDRLKGMVMQKVSVKIFPGSANAKDWGKKLVFHYLGSHQESTSRSLWSVA